MPQAAAALTPSTPYALHHAIVHGDTAYASWRDARLLLFGGAGFSDALVQQAATGPSVQLIGLDRLYHGL